MLISSIPIRGARHVHRGQLALGLVGSLTLDQGVEQVAEQLASLRGPQVDLGGEVLREPGVFSG